jgi:tetratricopeptide (TPR) repeat protein
MDDPVLMYDGYSYEREFAEKWLQESTVSPVTGKALEDTSLIPNNALRPLIAQWKATQSVPGNEFYDKELAAIKREVTEMKRERINKQTKINKVQLKKESALLSIASKAKAKGTMDGRTVVLQTHIDSLESTDKEKTIMGNYITEQQWEDAIIFSEERQNDLAVLTMRGIAFYHKKQPAEAIKCLETVFAKDNRNVMAINSLAIVLMSIGKFTEALTLLQHSHAIRPTPEVCNNLACVHSVMGKTKEALEALETSLALSAKTGKIGSKPYLAALCNRAKTRIELGDYENAYGDLAAVLKLDESNEKALALRAILKREAGNREECKLM